jgi:hypothetical protein
MAAKESGQQPARKVASPRKQAAKAAAGRKPAAAKAAPEVPEVPKKAVKATAAARTRTSAGATARTAMKPKGRTVTNADTVTMAVSDEPLNIVDVTVYDEPAPEPPAPPAPPAPEEDPEGVIQQTEVPFRDRMVLVKLPTTEQLTIYRRLSQKFIEIGNAAERPGAQPMQMEEAIKHYDRAVKLVTSVIVKEEDKEWLEDEMLEGRMELPDAIELLKGAFNRLAAVNDEGQNRAERRSSKARKARLGD